MGFIVGKVCPGIRNRTGAIVAAGASMVLAIALIIAALLGMLYTARETRDKVDRRTTTEVQSLQCYYGAGFALWGTWVMFTVVLISGIMVENKRALGFWLIFVVTIPVYFIGGLIFLVVADARDMLGEKGIGEWEIGYLVLQGLIILALVWICLAVWVYFQEIRQRDKNPELRENEIMFAQPFTGVMPPDGAFNAGYGVPSGGSMSSIPRSQRSRHTYAPTEAGESMRGGPTVPRQSRLDQYRAQHVERSPMKDRSPSGEREGGTTYYRYQYTAEQKFANGNGSFHGSQGSLGGRPTQPPSYQPARYQPRQPLPNAAQYGSQGSLGGRQAYQPSHHASQGSLGSRGPQRQQQPYQPQPYQPQPYQPQPYQPQRHQPPAYNGNGRSAPYNLPPQDDHNGKDSEV